jgi:small multidrug resistance pump
LAAVQADRFGGAYANWSGVGIAAVSTIGWYAYNQRLDGAAVTSLGLIVAGVVVLNLFSGAGVH